MMEPDSTATILMPLLCTPWALTLCRAFGMNCLVCSLSSSIRSGASMLKISTASWLMTLHRA